jgi:hypothetical protein
MAAALSRGASVAPRLVAGSRRRRCGDMPPPAQRFPAGPATRGRGAALQRKYVSADAMYSSVHCARQKTLTARAVISVREC